MSERPWPCGDVRRGNVSVPIFGGFAPFFAQSLIDLTGSKLAPSYYMIATALLSLAALIVLRRRHRL